MDERAEVRFVPADHDRQLGFLRADLTAGDRGVEATEAACATFVLDPLGERRVGSRHVDE